ncbi:hypothetical protein ACHWQZ_G011004 [Mnemiopsis leidyi]
MVNELDKKLVSKENRPLDKYVDLTKDYDDDFITLSAAHIEDAKYGRGHYGKAYAMESNSSSVRVAYNITFSVFWHYFTILIMVTHCLLVFYITNKPYYIILETACVLFYVLDVILHIIFYTPQTFFRISKRKMKTALKSKLQFILTVTFICDLGWTYYSYFYSDESLQEKAIPFQFLRSFVFILKIRTFYHFFMVVIKTIARILRTIFVIILYVLFFSCIAVHIFGEIYENSEDDNVYKYEFSNAARAFVRMFVLITTENYPDVMEPVYRYHNVTILYYIIFIYFGVFILTSILLAIVVDNYWTIAKMNVKKERLRGRKELAIAWNLLGDGAEKLSVYDENLLMVFRMLKPKNDDEEIIIFLQQLTGGMNSSIIEYKSWLTRCIDILDLEVERAADEEEGTNLISGLVKKSGGKFMIYLTLTIQSTALQRVVIILLFVHTFLIVVFQAGEEKLSYVVQWLRVGISALFVLEVSVRFSVLAYLHWEDSGRMNRTHRVMRWIKRASLMNVIDVVLVILGTTANSLWFYIDESYVVPENSKLTEFIAKGLCVVSSTIIFILRLLVNSEEATKVYALMKLIFPVMKDLSALFVIVIYSFACFGETIFTESVKQDYSPNPPQMFTSFGQSCQRYGFGSNWCSFVTIFQVSTTSNWHEKMQSIIESGAKYYGAVYFITTYIIFHMVIINLFVAISYEAYNKFVSKPKQAKKSQSASNKPKKLTQRIKSRMGKFKVFLNQYTKGTRKSVSSSPRPARRASVTIKRKSLHGMREKISDSSLGDAIPDIRSNGTIEPPKTPDLSSLPREKRHEMMLKQKMQQKGEARGRARRPRNTGDKVGSFAEVVRQYTAKSSEEISLAPGQRIKVLDKAGTKYKGVVVEGPNTGKNGWFPAFVVGSFVSDLNKNASEKKPLPKSESQPKFVRKQNADWTKDIIGPMTIMNPEELKELNKILKANARGSRSSTDSHRGSIDGGASPVSPKPNTSPLTPGPRVSARASNVPMMNIVEEEEEEEAEESDNDNVFLEINKLYSKPMQLPEVVIEQPSIVLEDEEEKEQDKKHLQSPKIHTPEMKAKEKWKKKMANKGKEIPDWARKFMSQTNTKVADSSAIKSPTESEETDPLSRITPGPLTSKEPQPGKSDSLQTESAVQTSKQSNSLLRGLRIKLPSDKDLVVINNIASDGTSPNNNLLVSENRGTESKSTILNIPESPDKNKPVVHVVATPSPTVTVVLPATDETSSQQPEQSQQNTAVAEPETESEKAKNNPESNSNRKFWRRNRRDKVSRSGSLPAALTSTLEKQPPVKRSETEVKIVVQPPAFEHIVDFE